MACCGGGDGGNTAATQAQNNSRSLPYKFLFKYIIVGDTGT